MLLTEGLLPAPRVHSTVRRPTTTALHHRLNSIIHQALCVVALIAEKKVEFLIQSIIFLLLSHSILLCERFHFTLVKVALVISVDETARDITPIVLKLAILEGR